MLRVSAAAAAALSRKTDSAGATFCIHHFSVGKKAARQSPDSPDTRRVRRHRGRRQKAQCHKKRRQKKKTLRRREREEMFATALAPDILMVSDLIETPPPFQPLFVRSLSAENICAAPNYKGRIELEREAQEFLAGPACCLRSGNYSRRV